MRASIRPVSLKLQISMKHPNAKNILIITAFFMTDHLPKWLQLEYALARRIVPSRNR